MAFIERLKAFGYEARHVLPHGNYLVNMGNPDAEVREKSYACFVDELKRCEALGLTLFNFQYVQWLHSFALAGKNGALT